VGLVDRNVDVAGENQPEQSGALDSAGNVPSSVLSSGKAG